ncbi:hypothetical protein [Streptomyces albipurpureus]|uniref:Uncharacterized protein n=1 Tax=Streptomyces albipurpureus TaxID=2897419 RepID=A0ABT0UJY8_9ACTN|nr:hypothetical protein [Streptomyces sp. CWNU-1]MCM2388818.1 hypothetical protein [Streptomyces sp. CWNU-1]
MNLVSMPQLCVAIRTHARLEAQLTESGNQLAVTLPSSLDKLVLTSGLTTGRPRIFWQLRSFLGTAKEECGYLDWSGESIPLVQFVIDYAYSSRQVAPQYEHIIDALRGRGLDAQLTVAEVGKGFQIRVDLPDGTFLLIGAGEFLPPRREQVEGWRVSHNAPDTQIAVVYDSVPESRVKGGSLGGGNPDLMADSVTRYVTGVVARYGGRHPLGSPVQQDSTTPGTVAWLLEELVSLRRRQADLGTAGSALITIAEWDGSAPKSVEVPAEVMNRISGLLLSEVTACQAYGG